MKNSDSMRGTTLLEVLIVFALAALVLGWTLPDPTQNLIRANVGHGLKIAASAQEALINTCESDDSAIVKSNLDAGFFYLPAGTEEDHLSRIVLGANCASQELVIVLWTSNTGAEHDPVIELVAVPRPNTDDKDSAVKYAWNCNLIQGEVHHVPAGCQNLYTKG